MPVRSRGCHLCRKRKVRCDERRPFCSRCATHGVPYPGFATDRPTDFEFRDQTDQKLRRVGYVNGLADSSPGSAVSSTQSRPLSPTKISFMDRVVQSPGYTIQSPNANRTQLYNTFMSLYYPQSAFTREEYLDTSTHHGFMRLLIALPSSRPALTYGLDALSLVQIGSYYKDRQLLCKAVHLYSLALSSLARALSNPANVKDDGVLTAATVLSVCEFYTEIRQGGDGWISHQHGIQKLVDARGPDSLDSRLATLPFYQAASKSLAGSLTLRKKDFFDAPKWLAKNGLTDVFIQSYRAALSLPGLLERHDLLELSSPGALLKLDALLAHCAELEKDMRQYATRTQLRAHADFGPILAEINHFQPFSALVQDRTLNMAFRFSSFMTASLHSQFCFRMCLLRENIRSLHRMRQVLIPSWQATDDQQVHGSMMPSFHGIASIFSAAFRSLRTVRPAISPL